MLPSLCSVSDICCPQAAMATVSGSAADSTLMPKEPAARDSSWRSASYTSFCRKLSSARLRNLRSCSASMSTTLLAAAACRCACVGAPAGAMPSDAACSGGRCARRSSSSSRNGTTEPTTKRVALPACGCASRPCSVSKMPSSSAAQAAAQACVGAVLGAALESGAPPVASMVPCATASWYAQRAALSNWPWQQSSSIMPAPLGLSPRVLLAQCSTRSSHRPRSPTATSAWKRCTASRSPLCVRWMPVGRTARTKRPSWKVHTGAGAKGVHSCGCVSITAGSDAVAKRVWPMKAAEAPPRGYASPACAVYSLRSATGMSPRLLFTSRLRADASSSGGGTPAPARTPLSASAAPRRGGAAAASAAGAAATMEAMPAAWPPRTCVMAHMRSRMKGA
jgi:hypothetical protein